ncbi:hypothetical protein G4359_07365 [Dorea longicatena]|nr:hypothetical protein [Dorea longicatena]NSD26056.1 hypothetical protein [Dorea longicatena]NSD41653.1 hypothetical protein [Dorea longicatena]NSD70726.1 hypothetical protein [Dorea longicatena]NSD73573.1 hypothetical protein [Dorea longicatena]
MFVVSVTVCLLWLRGTFVFSGRNQTFKNEQRKDSLFILFLCLHLGFGIVACHNQLRLLMDKYYFKKGGIRT